MNSINLINKIHPVKFGKSLSKAENAKKFLKAELEGEIAIMPKPVSYVRAIGNITAIESLAVGMLAVAKDIKEIAAFCITGGVVFRHVCISTHKEAIKQAASASAKLIDKGFAPNEIKFVANKIMSRNGNLVYSNLFKVMYPKRMQKICQGIETRSGFFHVPFDRIGKALKLEKAVVQ